MKDILIYLLIAALVVVMLLLGAEKAEYTKPAVVAEVWRIGDQVLCVTVVQEDGESCAVWGPQASLLTRSYAEGDTIK